MLTAKREDDSVEEDESDEGVSRSLSDMTIRHGSNHVDRDVTESGQKCSPEEKASAAELVDRQRTSDAADKGENGVQGVEEELLVCSCDAHILENHGHKVSARRAIST